MEVFVWNMAISFQLLFVIVSGVIFIYLREKSFKYYGLYNLFLGIYVLSRSDEIYYRFEGFIERFLGENNAEVFTHILSFFIQIIFYNLYSVFALYFLDLDRHTKKYFNKLIWLFRFLIIFFFVLGIVCYTLKNPDLYIDFYIFFYLPILLIIFLLTVFRAMKYSDKHKYFFLTGICVLVGCGLVAIVGSFVPALNMKDPITFFYVGIIMETTFFSLGLAYKVKLINDARNRVHLQIAKHKHQQQISKMNGLLEGEERERKRMAEELHDGIAGDLSAIKYNLAYLNMDNQTPKNAQILNEITEIIENSCLQIREISHNLSPSSITNFGLIAAIESFCVKIEMIYSIKINFKFSGERIDLNKIIETHIYRIVQEFINNIIKHSEAKEAHVEIFHHDPIIKIIVKDNGIGFTRKKSTGIGLSNIDSRIRFLNAQLEKTSTENGSSFTVTINVNNIPET